MPSSAPATSDLGALLDQLDVADAAVRSLYGKLADDPDLASECETNVRDGSPSTGASVASLFPACPECGGSIRTRKTASYCRPRCRAAASRRRKVEAALAKLDAAEQGLRDALVVVRDIRAALVLRGAP